MYRASNWIFHDYCFSLLLVMLFKIITSWSGFLCCWGSQISLSLFSWRRSQGCKIDIFPIAVCLKSWEKYFMSKDLARLNSLCSWLHCISRSQGVSFNWTKFLFLVGGINEHNSLHWCFNIFLLRNYAWWILWLLNNSDAVLLYFSCLKNANCKKCI